MKAFDLYMGLDTPYGAVTERDWEKFLHEAVDPRLEGYTIWDTEGRWRGSSEDSKVLRVLGGASKKRVLEDIARDYARQFSQESVLLAESEPIRVESCAKACREHVANPRQYAHVFHRPGVICVTDEFHDLPETHRLGLLLHEVGHLMAGPHGGESDANKEAEKAARLKIYYKDSRYGPQVEWIRPGDKTRARAFLGLG